MKRFLLRLAGLLVLVLVLAAGSAMLVSEKELRRRYPVSQRPVALPALGDTARGHRMATTFSQCTSCHGDDLGGRVLEDIPIFRAAPPNLTRGQGGIGDRLTLESFAGAVRNGVHPDGKSLMLMPSKAFATMSDADLHALFSYIQSLPPVDRNSGASYFKFPGRVLLALGKFKLSAEVVPASVMPAATTPTEPMALGKYITGVAGCAYCHGDDFRGRATSVGPPDAPLPTNISPSGIGHWSEADFVRALRTGVRPEGRAIDPFMPWKNFSGMTDEELHALWTYLSSLPHQAMGGDVAHEVGVR